ncbi:MAG: YqhA family protein [Synechococcus sp.]|nr:YqhA family protein [Synechococcus sp.]
MAPPPIYKRLELRFERVLWRLRLMAILPVLLSLASAMLAFVLGTVEIIRSLRYLNDHTDVSSQAMAKLLGGMVSGIDLYLIGIALMIFGYGVYELMISPIDAARGQSRAGEGLLDIRDLDQLKEKLVKVLVVALIVAAFKAMLTLPINDGPSLAYFCLSVLLLAISGFLVTGGISGHGRSGP